MFWGGKEDAGKGGGGGDMRFYTRGYVWDGLGTTNFAGEGIEVGKCFGDELGLEVDRRQWRGRCTDGRGSFVGVEEET